MNRVAIAATALVFLSLNGCPGDSRFFGNPEIAYLLAEPFEGNNGSTTRLRWRVMGDDPITLSLSGTNLDPVDVTGSNSKEVTPEAPSTTYTLVASNSNGSDDIQLVVKVND